MCEPRLNDLRAASIMTIFVDGMFACDTAMRN